MAWIAFIPKLAGLPYLAHLENCIPKISWFANSKINWSDQGVWIASVANRFYHKRGFLKSTIIDFILENFFWIKKKFIDNFTLTLQFLDEI